MLNILFSAAFIAISAVLLINAQGIPGATKWDIIGSRLFPQMMIGAMGICSVVVFIDSVRKYLKRKAEGKEDGVFIINRKIFVLFVALLVWISCIKILGFYSSSLVFLIFLHWFLNDMKFNAAIIVTPVVSLVAIYFIFGKFLKVILPEGMIM